MAKRRSRSSSEDTPVGGPIPKDWRPRATSAEQLAALVERLPEEPGVYLMRDRRGAVVYVGKARRLRARVRQYFNGHDSRSFVPKLAGMLGDIETVVTSNDKEALLLENNLIKRLRPRFNVKLRDDKQYLVLRIDPTASWPRLELVRRMRDDAARYFGPYHSAVGARRTLRVVNRHFQLRTCSDFTLAHRARACLQYQIGRCPAPCVYEVDAEAYAAQVRGVVMFLSGRHNDLTRELRARMNEAAEALEFEQAARYRDQLQAIETSLEHQRVVSKALNDQDVVGMYREGGQVEFVVMHVRQGKLLGARSHSARNMELPDHDVLHSFLSAYYEHAPTLPDEVLLPTALREDDAAPLEEWLGERAQARVRVLVPARGDRHKLVRLASRNAASNFVTRRNHKEDADAALNQLRERLSLSRTPRVIECYDISHIQGSDPVASMVVFVDGAPARDRYRSFRIKGDGLEPGLAQGAFQNDDFASMHEVLSRRLRRGLAAQADLAGGDEDRDEDGGEDGIGDDRREDGGGEGGVEGGVEDGDGATLETAEDSWALPDLLVIDGGKGQLGRVVAAMQDLGVPIGAEGVDVISLAKERRTSLGRGREALRTLRSGRTTATADAKPGAAYQDWVLRDGAEESREERAEESAEESVEESAEVTEVAFKPERVFVPGAKEAMRLRAGSSELFLLTQIRDEAHRFAITHHRKRRGKRALSSSLDGIKGVGPALKRALLKHFGTIAAVRAADPEALQAVSGVGPKLARTIHAALSG